jgi:glycosyltransferase involved in cell wall biosynthesis
MATVMSHMAAIADPEIHIRVVPTYVDASRGRWLWVGVRGMLISSWLVLTGRVDVLHVHLGHGGSVVRKAAPLWSARLRKVPAVIHAHSYDFAGWYRTQRPIAQAGIRRALSADLWIILGRDLAEEYADSLNLPSNKVAVLRNPVRIPSLPDRGGPSRPLRVVSLGRLGQRKGSYDIVSAVAALSHEERAAVHIHLAGDGEVDKVRTAVHAAGLGKTVTVHGWLNAQEGAELLSRADIFALPSYAEGLPMALLEAMAAAVAVITTPVGSITEIVRDGENGILVPPGDVAALTTALRTLISDDGERNRLGVAGRETVRSLDIADWEAQLGRVWKLLADR